MPLWFGSEMTRSASQHKTIGEMRTICIGVAVLENLFACLCVAECLGELVLCDIAIAIRAETNEWN